MTLKEAVMWGKNKLTEADIKNADYDSFELLSFINGMTKTSYFVNGNSDISEETFSKYRELIEKRASHVPLQHIVGSTCFYGYDFEVNSDVLIPRHDTEVLVEAVSKLKFNKEDGACINILDMCTGSGCIAITLSKLINNSQVLGVDISDKALLVANRNKTKLDAANVSFLQSNLFDELDGFEIFDCIVSNPPYIPTADINELEDEVRLHDPMLALDGHEDGLDFYRTITNESKHFLKKNGWLCYEIGATQAQDVLELMDKAGFSDIKVIKDLAGLDRVVIGRKVG